MLACDSAILVAYFKGLIQSFDIVGVVRLLDFPFEVEDLRLQIVDEVILFSSHFDGCGIDGL